MFTYFVSANRFKSYLPYLLTQDLSQPAKFPLWRRWITYSSFSLPLFVAFIINAEKKFCQEAANTFSIYSHKKTASKRSCVHLSTLKLSWRTSTPAEDHVEEVSSFLLRRKNDDRWYRSGVSTQPFNLLFRIRGYWPSEYHILWYSIKKCPLESSRHLRRPLRIE